MCPQTGPSGKTVSDRRPFDADLDTVPVAVPEGRPYAPGEDPLLDFTYLARRSSEPLRPVIPLKGSNVLVVGLGKMKNAFMPEVRKDRMEAVVSDMSRREEVVASELKTMEMARRSKSASRKADKRIQDRRMGSETDNIIQSSCRPPGRTLKDSRVQPGSLTARRVAKRRPSFMRLFLRDRELDTIPPMATTEAAAVLNGGEAEGLSHSVPPSSSTNATVTEQGSVLTSCTTVDEATGKRPPGITRRKPLSLGKVLTWGRLGRVGEDAMSQKEFSAVTAIAIR